jgi:hypothetical protein
MKYLSLFCKIVLQFALLLLIGLSVMPSARADNLYARIHGTVTDSSGAVVPGVTVVAFNVETGISRTIITDANGNYEFLQLPIGTYRISASKDGFKKQESHGITLALDQNYVLPIQLEIGTTSQTIEVEANPVQVESTSNQLGTVIQGKTIVDMPLLGRNWIQLQQLQTGVVGTSDRFGDTFATNGSQAQQNSYLIDGIDDNDISLNDRLLIPSPDAIAEFNMVTNTINAEYGRNSGAILNAAIKSGTNSFHGDLFEFYRDTFLNTKNYFALTPAPFHQNLFGGTIGGPIWKNHTFFFFSYQGDRASEPDTSGLNENGGNPTVFTAAQRNGDFSGGAAGCPFGSNVSPIPLQNSSGITQPAGTPYCTLWPSGIIPTANFNLVSQGLLKFVPLPNFGANTFVFNPIETITQDQYIFRIDHTFNASNTLWGSAALERFPDSFTLPFLGANLPGFGQIDDSHTKQITIAFNHTFSPTMLNEIRGGYSRQNFAAVFPTDPALPSTFGFTGITPQSSSGANAPLIGVTGFFTLGFSGNGPQPRIENTYQFTDNFSKIIGKHSLKAGFEMRRYHVFNPFSANNNGNFTFGATGQFSTGNPGADFLLGLPDSYTQGSGDTIDATTQEYYSYVQDQWKVRDNLTLNYGLGWQIDTPLSDNFNNGLSINCFSPGVQSTIYPTAPAGLVFPGEAGCTSTGGVQTSYRHVGPRVGFAYSPDLGRLSGGPGKLSIRAGYGIYFNRGEEELALQNVISPPFSTSINTQNPSFANPFVPINGGPAANNPFPASPPPPGSNVDFTQFGADGSLFFNVVNPKFVPGYSENYNLTIQRELPAHTVLSVGYVGAEGRHEQITIEQNPITLAGAALCAADPSCVSQRSLQHLLFPTHSIFPGDEFGSVGQEASFGNSNYNSLQVGVNKAPTHGLSFLVSYTYAHSLDLASSFENADVSGTSLGTNPFNPQVDYADSLFDVRHRLVTSFTYEIPNFRHVRGLGFLPDRFSNGWRLTGIDTLQTGLPVVIKDSGFTSLTCDALSFYGCWDLPNQVAPVRTLDPRSAANNDYFNPADFAVATLGTIGDVGRNPFHGPGLNNLDIVFAKDTRVTESTRLELRFEAYNVFNHAQFFNPIGDINASNFGQVVQAHDPRLIQLGAKFYF